LDGEVFEIPVTTVSIGTRIAFFTTLCVLLMKENRRAIVFVALSRDEFGAAKFTPVAGGF
jgi:hypothetical protein